LVFFLFIWLLSIVVTGLDMTFFGSAWGDFEPIDMIVTLGAFIPSISAATRRLHDSGKSGWWQLLSDNNRYFCCTLYWLIRSGDDHENKYTQSESITTYR